MATARRTFLKQSVAASLGGAASIAQAISLDERVDAEMASRLKFLTPPQGTPPTIQVAPSPPVTPFKTPFFRPCVPEALFAFLPSEYPTSFQPSSATGKRIKPKKPQISLSHDDVQRVIDRLSRRQLEQTSDRDLAWLAGFWKRFAEAADLLAGISIDLGYFPDPFAHQRFFDFKPQYFYAMWEVEFNWRFHEDYGKDSYNWGFASFCDVTDDPQGRGNFATYPHCTFQPLQRSSEWPRPKSEGLPAKRLRLEASSPGPTFRARYDEPVMVRRINALPEILNDEATSPNRRRIKFALPSTTTHLHNAHTASESDGHPNDWINSGEYWDHHYGNFPSGYDPNEKLSTLWYHDHRMDFTAANVYAGLDGFYTLYDEQTDERGVRLPKDELQDIGEEGEGWGLPSGDYDIPMILHDLMFARPEDKGDEAVKSTGKKKRKKSKQGGSDESPQLVFDGFNTDGILGDRLTVNRIIQPVMKVEPRKYRFRILNGGPSRFYELTLHTEEPPTPSDGSDCESSVRNAADCDVRGEVPFVIIAGDGNFQPNPLLGRSLYFGVAQRCDVIIDFSEFADQNLYLVNILDQINGQGPSGREFNRETYHKVQGRKQRETDDGVEWFFHDLGLVKFEVQPAVEEEDKSTLPLVFRPFPPVDLTEVRRERLWEFDFDGGLWTINGMVYDPNRIDAGIEQDTAEIWTMRNVGLTWSHPIHSHFTEFIILEINGVPQYQYSVQESEIPKQGPYYRRPQEFLDLTGDARRMMRTKLQKFNKKWERSKSDVKQLLDNPPAAMKQTLQLNIAEPDGKSSLTVESLLSGSETGQWTACQWEQALTAATPRLDLAKRVASDDSEEVARLETVSETVRWLVIHNIFYSGSDDFQKQITDFLSDDINKQEPALEGIRFHRVADFRILVILLRILGIASLDLRRNEDAVKGNGRFMGGPRRDVALLLPGWEVTMFIRWKDFLGKHVMHCHNVVHEDHAMMIRWDIVPPGHGFDTPKRADSFYAQSLPHIPHVQPMPEHSQSHENDSDGPLKR